jgi:RND family efflux transporter MFP subunit
MSRSLSLKRSSIVTRSLSTVLAACFFLACHAGYAGATGIEGFTQPYREIDVASAETGILVDVDVEEGDEVRRDQPLARLNYDVIEASLRIADKQQQARGQLDSAEAELRLRSDRLGKLKALLENNHASREEVERAVAEKDIAQARVLAAEEALEVKGLEYERIKTQLERRRIMSPANGVVKRVHKEIGEFVAPTDPIVLTIVQLDPLLATFAVPAPDASKLTDGQTIGIQFGTKRTTVNGSVKCIAPVVDAQSGTVTVKVEFPNPQGGHRSGERCVLLLTDEPAKLTRTLQTRK